VRIAAHGVSADAIDVVRVPGAWEIPCCGELASSDATRRSSRSVVWCAGTRHYEHVADGCAQGLMRVALDHGMPVLTAYSRGATPGRAVPRGGATATRARKLPGALEIVIVVEHRDSDVRVRQDADRKMAKDGCLQTTVRMLPIMNTSKRRRTDGIDLAARSRARAAHPGDLCLAGER